MVNNSEKDNLRLHYIMEAIKAVGTFLSGIPKRNLMMIMRSNQQ